MAKKLPMFTFEQEQSPWHTGTPTEEGWYVLLGDNWFDDYHVNHLKIGENGLEWQYYNLGKIIAWMPFETYKDKGEK